MQQLSNQEAEKLVREGVQALQSGRGSLARSLFNRIAETGRANAQIWLLLAIACRTEGDMAATEAAVDRLLALEPRMVRGHILKGDCRSHAGDEGAALGYYESARLLADGQALPPDLVAELRRIESAIEELKERIEARREAALVEAGLTPDTRSPRFQQALDILSGRKRIFVQEPTAFYFPGLPQIQFYDPASFAWAAPLEASTAAIRGELARLLESTGTKDFRPYIQSDPNRPRRDDNPLLDSTDWSALFLIENGKIAKETIARCPRTWEAVQAAPLPHMTNSPSVMFSLLRPGSRIVPHTGMFNTRLVCHLPLIVPPGCGFRVGNEVREWEVGKLFIFDDTIEHEAWNDSGDDRVVLIFDIWRPELSHRERDEVTALFASSPLGSR
ncbi:aspartyl/asparaginyl beta-hydroxylase domain-containing protein [Allosphingosinicella deserti]|nr:aspartyl/asparaginyl beta-hydroxylase domain-containing protein [Sphingomonas deserti]